MKQIVTTYSYSPTTNVVTLTGVNIDADQLLLIVAPQVSRTMYNFASVTGVVSAGVNTRVTLNASTAGLTTTSPLVIFYDDQASTQTVAGTVTANGGNFVGVDGQPTPPLNSVQLGYYSSDANSYLSIGDGFGLPVKAITGSVISGTVTVGNSVTIGSLPAISGTVTVGSSVTIGSLPTLTPQLPRVTFIDGSGTVVTANSAVTLFASSSTRSYLLVQVTTGSAFVNVGATATTVNGISLTAGQGYAWETTIPQGAVSLISTTTNSAYVAKQA